MADIDEIIKGCANNDRKSQKYLYEKFYSKMLNTCLRYTHDYDEAKDILQEGFLKIFGSISNYTDSGSFEGWMKRIMVNTAIDYYRKKKRENFITTDSDFLLGKEEDQIATDSNLEEEDVTAYNLDPKIVMEEIQNLSPAYRIVFNMYVMEGYSHKQIAEILEISEGTSKSNLAKAKMNLQKKLSKYIVKS